MKKERSNQSERDPIDAILDPSGFSEDKLADIASMFDLFARSLAAALREWSPTPFRISVVAVEPAQLGQKLQKSSSGVCARLKCEAMDNRVWMSLEPAARNALMAAAFGAESELADGDSLPDIESAMTSRFFEYAAGAVNAMAGDAFGGGYVCDEFFFSQSKLGVEQRDFTVVLVTIEIVQGASGGMLRVFLPIAAAQILWQATHREDERDRDVADGIWADELRTGVDMTQIPMRAVVDQFPMSLGAISQLRAGAVLELRATDISEVAIYCADAALFACELGREAGRYTLRVLRPAGSRTAAEPWQIGETRQ